MWLNKHYYFYYLLFQEIKAIPNKTLFQLINYINIVGRLACCSLVGAPKFISIEY